MNALVDPSKKLRICIFCPKNEQEQNRDRHYLTKSLLPLWKAIAFNPIKNSQTTEKEKRQLSDLYQSQ